MFCSIVLLRFFTLHSGGSHLSAEFDSALSFRFIPSERRPYQHLGFSLEGFTAFHSVCFQTDYVTVALFRVIRPYHSDTGRFPAVSLVRYQTALTYGFVRHEHYSRLRLCEHGLSSAPYVQRLPECLMLHFVTNAIITRMSLFGNLLFQKSFRSFFGSHVSIAGQQPD